MALRSTGITLLVLIDDKSREVNQRELKSQPDSAPDAILENNSSLLSVKTRL